MSPVLRRRGNNERGNGTAANSLVIDAGANLESIFAIALPAIALIASSNILLHKGSRGAVNPRARPSRRLATYSRGRLFPRDTRA